MDYSRYDVVLGEGTSSKLFAEFQRSAEGGEPKERRRSQGTRNGADPAASQARIAMFCWQSAEGKIFCEACLLL